MHTELLNRLHRLDERTITLNKIRKMIHKAEDDFWKTNGENHDSLTRLRELWHKLSKHNMKIQRTFPWNNMRSVTIKPLYGI